MKVTLRQETGTKGLVFKKEIYSVLAHIELSKEEQKVAKQNEFGRLAILEGEDARRPVDDPDGTKTHPAVYAGHLYDKKPYKHSFYTQAEANEFQAKMEAAIRWFKGMLDKYGTPEASESKSFDL